MNPTEATDSMPPRPSTPTPGVVSSTMARSPGPASAANVGLPVKSWKPPARTNPSQTFTQFKRKVESEWGGTFLQTKSGDVIIMIAKRDVPDLLLSTLLDELSDTDGKAKGMRVFDNTGNYSIVVYDAILRELVDEQEEEEQERPFWLPNSVFASF